jgi:ankyrin repeat protein
VQELVVDRAHANAQNTDGNTILMLACRYVSEGVIRFLVDSGADLCVCCDAGKTAFHDLLWMLNTVEQFPVVELLMKNSGPLRNLLLVEDQHGFTPLDYLPKEMWHEFNKFLTANADQFWPPGQQFAVPVAVPEAEQ